MIFTKMRYGNLKKENPDLSFKELNQKMSEEYKNLTSEERAKWINIADEQNAERKQKFDESRSQVAVVEIDNDEKENADAAKK